ncbi:GT47 [Ectocarpus sp. CCAP 1310/34]|nr:GT47 [Ectocarpus sp. CCAP 1310/34]
MAAAPGFTRHSFFAETDVKAATTTNVTAAPRPTSPLMSPRHSRRCGQHNQTTRTAAVSPAGTVARLFRKNRRILAVISVAVAALLLILALTAYAGLWPWRDLFPYKGVLFHPAKDCLMVNTRAEVACGSPWSAPCFDLSRCRGGGGGSLSVYVHDETCSMRKTSEIMASYGDVAVSPPWDAAAETQLWNAAAKTLRLAAAERGLLVDTPDEACIVFYAVPRDKAECVSKTPTWGGGQNHALLDLNDESRAARRSLDGKAMFLQSNMRPCYYRHGYDIAMPLPARRPVERLREGKLYLSGNGFLERSAVLDLMSGGASAAVARAEGRGEMEGANGDSHSSSSPDVLVVERCCNFHSEQLLSWNKAMCEASQREYYSSPSFGELMNTTFALLPAGRSPATYRLAEALSAGALPVFIHQDGYVAEASNKPPTPTASKHCNSQDFVKPFPGKIRWSEFSFTFPPEEVPRMLKTLRAVPDKELARMQASGTTIMKGCCCCCKIVWVEREEATALEVFDTYFGLGMGNMLHTVLDILEDRLYFRS